MAAASGPTEMGGRGKGLPKLPLHNFANKRTELQIILLLCTFVMIYLYFIDWGDMARNSNVR